jgi:hypothetical protein
VTSRQPQWYRPSQERRRCYPPAEPGRGADDPPRGTVEDGKAVGCFGSSGRPYAIVVWVRIGERFHAVLMPDIKHPDSVEAYWNFLNNDRETLSVQEATFDWTCDGWEVCRTAIPLRWPKAGGVFGFG